MDEVGVVRMNVFCVDEVDVVRKRSGCCVDEVL